MSDPKRNYLQNRDVLRNILLSKASYTWYIDGNWKNTQYLDYDTILCDKDTYQESKDKLVLQKVNKKRLDKGEKRVSVMKEEFHSYLEDEDYQDIDNRIIFFDGTFDDPKVADIVKLGHYNRKLYEDGRKRVSEITDEIREAVDFEDVCVRVFTYEHIPYNPQKELAKCKKISDYHEKVNFPPYKHYAIHNGVLQCVAMSHHDDNMEFDTEHGTINTGLSLAFMKLCQKYSSRFNWRGYSYCEDMQAQALFQLVTVGLQFNELFSSNPFSYYTSTIKNAFTVTFNEEKKAQDIRDDLLVKNNQSPSWTRQLESDLSRSEHWDKVLDNNSHDSGKVTQKELDEDFDDEGIDEYEDEIEYES